MEIDLRVKKDIYVRTLTYLAMFFLACSYILTSLYIIFIILIIVAVVVHYSGLDLRHSSLGNNNFIIVMIFTLLILLPSLLMKEYHLEYIKQVVIMFTMITSGFLLSKARPFSLFLSRLPFFTISFYYLYLYASGVPSSQFLQGNSENFISVSLFLTYVLTFSLSKRYRVDVIVLIMTAILFFLSLISVGRSGIVTSAFIFIFTMLIYFNERLMKLDSRVVRFLTYGISFFLFTIAISFLGKALIESGLIDRILNRGFTDYSREFIIAEYRERLYNVTSLLGGVDIYLVKSYSKYGYNLHNSYLSIHAFFGVIFFVLYILLIMQASIWLFVKKNFVLLIPLVAILVRALTDIQILGGKLDWIIFFIIFTLLKGKNTVK